MAIEEAIVPAASAAAGGITTLWVAKVMIQRWLEKNDTSHDKWDRKTGEILVAVTRIEEQVKFLREHADRGRETEKQLAVLERGFDDLRKGLNGLGAKVRGLAADD